MRRAVVGENPLSSEASLEGGSPSSPTMALLLHLFQSARILVPRGRSCMVQSMERDLEIRPSAPSCSTHPMRPRVFGSVTLSLQTKRSKVPESTWTTWSSHFLSSFNRQKREFLHDPHHRTKAVLQGSSIVGNASKVSITGPTKIGS